MRRTETTYSREGLMIARDYEHCLSSMCHHVSNDSYYGKPFLLEPFQRENMWKPLFACGHMENGKFKRDFRRAIFGLPSGLGKTELAAALVLVISTMEIIYNGQYCVVASSKDQVKNIFEKIVTMIKLNSTWKEQWNVNKDVIENKQTGSKIMVLPNKADALESWHFNVLVFDELHTYKDSKVWDAGLKGKKVLENPLSIGITTAGDSREGFLWETLEKADKDKGMYLYWLGLDDKDNINDKRAWEKLMVASWVTWESIQDQRGMASTERAFERYAANRFPKTSTSEACFTSLQLDTCERGKNDFDFDSPFTLGIDGATSGDSFAIVAYQERENKNGNAKSFTKSWIFDEPGDDGYYDTSQIAELIASINEHYPEVIGVDPNRMIVLSHHLEDMYGIEPVSFAQNNQVMCQATAIVMNLVRSKKLKLKGEPKLRRHLENTVKLEREPYGVRFGKDEKRSKIDGAIALGIASLAYKKLVEGNEGNVVPF